MTTTIDATNGAGSSSPLSVLSPYEIAYASRNVVLDLLGGGIAVALMRPRPSSGTISYLFDDETGARLCVALHLEESSFVLSDTGRPDVGMTYVVDGDVRLRLDEDTLRAWIVEVDFQEVEP